MRTAWNLICLAVVAGALATAYAGLAFLTWVLIQLAFLWGPLVPSV